MLLSFGGMAPTSSSYCRGFCKTISFVPQLFSWVYSTNKSSAGIVHFRSSPGVGGGEFYFETNTPDAANTSTKQASRGEERLTWAGR